MARDKIKSAVIVTQLNCLLSKDHMIYQRMGKFSNQTASSTNFTLNQRNQIKSRKNRTNSVAELFLYTKRKKKEKEKQNNF